MKRATAGRFSFVFMIPVILMGIWTFNTVIAETRGLCVCHVENKETGRGHVIEVDKNSLEGHLRHGDMQCAIDCEEAKGKDCNLSTGSQCAPDE